jgi:DNA-binding transcriptional LysR family regulator
MERLECDRMFVAVMETGSFAKAALRLHTSSGQASKMVSRLEQVLGARLLNRSTRAISPTDIGQAYFERIKTVLEDIDALDESIKAQSGSPKGKLRITVPSNFVSHQLSLFLIAFAKAYPGLELDIAFTNRLVNLIDEGFDAGIRIGKPQDSSLVSRKLSEVRTAVLASPIYLAARGAPQSPEELSGHDCILDTNFRDPAIWRFRAPKTGAPITVTVNGRLRFSSGEACVAAAEDGMGITRVPVLAAVPRLTDGELTPILQDFEDAPIGMYVIYPSGRHLALKMRALIDFLSDRFKG